MSYGEIFGALSCLMTFLSRANYLNAVFRGRASPHAFSWFIWGTISGISFAAQVSEGAGAGSWARGFGCAMSFVLVILALSSGNRNVKRGDWITLAVALCAIPLWMATKTPLWSVLLVCGIDTLGCYPTLRKSWDKPWQEPAGSYAISIAGGFFSLLAIDHYNLSTWLHTAVGAANNAAIVGFLLWRRRALQPA
jgi:hypothetical protein